MSKHYRASRQGLSFIELIVIIGLIVMVTLIALPTLTRNREICPGASCQNNLKQMGLVFKMYSNESVGGYFPPLHVSMETPVDCASPGLPEVGDAARVTMLMPNVRSIYPEYMTDLNVIACPSDLDRFEYRYTDGKPVSVEYCEEPPYGLRGYDLSYIYFPWVFDQLGSNEYLETVTVNGDTGPSPMQLLSVVRGLNTSLDRAQYSLQDLIVADGLGNAVGDRIYRMVDGVEKFFITDTNDPTAPRRVQAEIPIMMDRIDIEAGEFEVNHVPAGGNVLYLDGHVARVELNPRHGWFKRETDRYPPLNPGVARALALFEAN